MRQWLGRLPVKLLLALLVVQAGYWLAFYPNFLNPATPPGAQPLALESFEYARIEKPDPELLPTAKFQPVPEEQPMFLWKGYYAWRASFALEEVPHEGLAVLVAESASNHRIYANGSLVYGEGRMDIADVTYHGELRKVIRVPSGLLQQGQNTISAIDVMEYSEDGILPPPLVGEYASVMHSFGWKAFLFGPYRIISTAVGLVVSLLLGVVLLRAQDKRFLLWFFLLSLGWSLAALMVIWATMPLHGTPRSVAYFGLALLICASWPLMVDGWTRRPLRWFRLPVFAACGGALIWAIIMLYFAPENVAFERAEYVVVRIGLLLMVAAMLRLGWHVLRQREERVWEAALLATMAIIAAQSFFNGMTDIIDFGYFSRSTPLFLLLFAVAYLARNIRLFRSQEQINSLLQAQLDERTAELELAHARETQLVRQQAHHEERGRIMRDMHDGLGSNLMSMLLAARRGVAEPTTVAEGLQGVVDEMRLMIDSMDSVGESLATALATFRGRVADRVTGAGFKLDWQDSATRPLPDYSPRAVLQVFRVMQEAVTNALKHSGGDVIAISIVDGTAKDEALAITIADNGGGKLGPQNGRGRGLSNMQSRAAMIGASLALEESDSGLAVRLGLPAHTEMA
ncbi:MAG: hypothetical protein H6918_06600 [Sphingomonadaceae bacterium]|nr:hypothetical protein [Sphingomonadaceae bacterium]